MQKVEVNLENGIRWPNKCAICSEQAVSKAKTHFRVIDGYFLVAIRETTHTVEYPVCSKHKWTSKFYGFVTNQAWPTGFVMFLIFPLIFALPLLFASSFLGKLADILFMLSYPSFAVWIIYLKMRNPVKIIKAKKSKAVVRLKNHQYADEFRLLNTTK